MLEIVAPSRLHITLIDLGARGYRRNGGAGFFINEPGNHYLFERSKDVNLEVLQTLGYSRDEIASLTDKIIRIRRECGGSGIALLDAKMPQRHFGFGSGTSATLACVEAFTILNEIPSATERLIRFSGRGGTSGIGVHGYFTGGFTMDLGKPYDYRPIKSSDDISFPLHLPLLLSNLPMPSWKLGIFIPPRSVGVTPEAERCLFSNGLPLRAEQVHEIAYHCVFGLLPAVAEKDFNAFCMAINSLQRCAWKAAEICVHGDTVRRYMDSLSTLGCDAVGMSSVGPALYFFSSRFEETFSRVRSEYPDAVVFCGTVNNSGRKVTHA